MTIHQLRSEIASVTSKITDTSATTAAGATTTATRVNAPLTATEPINFPAQLDGTDGRMTLQHLSTNAETNAAVAPPNPLRTNPAGINPVTHRALGTDLQSQHSLGQHARAANATAQTYTGAPAQVTTVGWGIGLRRYVDPRIACQNCLALAQCGECLGRVVGRLLQIRDKRPRDG